MSTPTDLPIHDVILKIMYNADREKPIDLTAGDILWKIDNPEITERYVREVLDWLVREKRVQLYLNKYILDRHEFLDQKTKTEEDEEVIIETRKETFYIKPSKKKIKNIRSIILFFIGAVALLYVTYLYTKMEKGYEIVSKQITPTTIVNQQIPIKNLFLSNSKEENMNKKIENISYLFSRQNSNNIIIRNELSKLYKISDSLQKRQQSELTTMQIQFDNYMNENNNYMDKMLKKIILCNSIILLIIALTFFKGKI